MSAMSVSLVGQKIPNLGVGQWVTLNKIPRNIDQNQIDWYIYNWWEDNRESRQVDLSKILD